MSTPAAHGHGTSRIAPHRRFWPRRVPFELPAAQTTLWDNLDISARRYPDKPAFVFFGQALGFAQLREQAVRLAGWLHEKAGVRQGDRVVLALQNSPQNVIAFYALLRLRAVIVPANPMSRGEEFAHYIADSQARLAIGAADLVAEFGRAQSLLAPDARLERLLVADYTDAMPTELAPEDAPPAAWLAWLRPAADMPSWALHWRDAMTVPFDAPDYVSHADDLMALCYTSGTTGQPKGCMHTHRTIGHNVHASQVWNGVSAADVMLGVVPMFHITGMLFSMHAPICAGATTILLPRWDRELAGRLISRHQVSSWVNIPTMIIDLLGSPNFASFDLSSLRYIGGGGAAMPQAVAERLKALYGLDYVEGYGLTETAAPSHSNPPDAAKLQCLGIPYVGIDARVIDPDTLLEVPQGQSGEIVIHGPPVFKGYWRRPEATEAVFLELDGRRFFRTGDLGRIDEDGYFFITDRLKRMINASGYKVWPAEVENMLYQHPDIQEACVIAMHDDYRGETVKAVVVLRAGSAGKLDAAGLEAWARERMAAYKVPRTVEFVDALPKSGSGKVLWRLLQEKESTA
ncbi:MAG: long-chain fatty acid--CoA ligase [Burkholderiaceae bacterium]|nr:long-chain fatty acid--CoA ligase [Burkholderiaceae bacterium]